MFLYSMRKLIEETEKADEVNKKKLVEDSNMTGRQGNLSSIETIH